MGPANRPRCCQSGQRTQPWQGRCRLNSCSRQRCRQCWWVACSSTAAVGKTLGCLLNTALHVIPLLPVLCRLPEAQFYIPLQHQLQLDPSGTHTLLPSQPQHAPKPAAAAAGPGVPSAAAATASGGPAAGSAAGAAATPLSPSAAAAAAVDGPGVAAAAAGCGADGSPTSPQQLHSTGRKAQRRAQQQQIVVPGPEEICEPGAAWGVDNRWIEAWDEAEGEQCSSRMASIQGATPAGKGVCACVLLLGAGFWHHSLTMSDSTTNGTAWLPTHLAEYLHCGHP